MACVLGADWQREDLIAALRQLGAFVIGVDRSVETQDNVDELILESVAPIDLTLSAQKVVAAAQRQRESSAYFPILVDTELGLPLAMAIAPSNYEPFLEMQLLDKAHQYEYLAAAGVSIPRWVMAEDIHNMPAVSYFNADVVVKPRIGWAALDVRFPSPDEVVSGDVIIQEVIHGDVVVLVLCIKQGRPPKILGAIRHGQTFGLIRPGHSAISIPTTPELQALAIAVSQALDGFRGVLQVEAILDRFGIAYLLEVTPIIPNFMIRSLLGIEVQGAFTDGSLELNAAPPSGAASVAAWLYPEGQGSHDTRLEGVRTEMERSADVIMKHAPATSVVFPTDSTSRPVGVIVASSSNIESAAERLRVMAASTVLNLDDGSSFAVDTLGVEDICQGMFPRFA